MTILVTGATGQLGSQVVRHLLTLVPPQRVAVSVRSPIKADALRLRGVSVRQGDFDEPESLDSAFAGVERLLIISTNALDSEVRIRQHQNAVEAAQRAGVSFIAYTSCTRADTSPLALAQVHKATEDMIRGCGIRYAFLRNNWYIENEICTIESAANGSPIYTAAGAGRVGWAARKDYADAAAELLASSLQDDTIYELCGPMITYDELARIIGSVARRNVYVKHMSDTEYETMLQEGRLDPGAINFLVDVQRGIREEALEVHSNDLQRLLGRAPTPLDDAIAGMIRGLRSAA